MKLSSGGFGGEGGGWQGRPEGHDPEDFENMNLANFLGEDHSELLGWSPSGTKAAKVISLSIVYVALCQLTDKNQF